MGHADRAEIIFPDKKPALMWKIKTGRAARRDRSVFPSDNIKSAKKEGAVWTNEMKRGKAGLYIQINEPTMMNPARKGNDIFIFPFVFFITFFRYFCRINSENRKMSQRDFWPQQWWTNVVTNGKVSSQRPILKRIDWRLFRRTEISSSLFHLIILFVGVRAC